MDLGFWNERGGYSRRLKPWLVWGFFYSLPISVSRMFTGNPKDIILGPLVWAAVMMLLALLAWSVVRLWDKLSKPKVPAVTYHLTED